uniref:ATP synthase F0 subunit 8 n=1 Tax=Coccinella septempunctata TaxID=41139 RepID=I6NMV7_COCSE|nr:ATP synthase F0 subunit 8 [Coccinella septempunctata]UXW88381.1 ATP synthase F0 subunit 8 [Coccinella septempunctata]
MPQAMPMNWIILFLLFTLIFMLINMKLYFNNKMTPQLKLIKFKKLNNWKW